MSVRVGPGFAAALALSTALHAAGLFTLAPDAALQIEGGAGAVQASLGNSFADLAQGAAAVKTAALVVPPPSARATPVQATARAAPVAVPEAIAVPPQQVVPAASDRVAARPVADHARPVAPLAVAPDASGSRTDSPRPQARPAKPPEKVAPARKAAKPSAARTAESAAVRGDAAGTASGTAARAQGAVAPAAEAGNAAVSNYGGQVMKRITRTRRHPAPARGRAVVGFTIAADGGLAAARILRSSGSEALDRVALDHIRRAAPFPKPPQGARRDWSFEFIGKP